MHPKCRNRPSVESLEPLAREVYHDSAGCCLHIVLEDGNTEDSSVQWCLEHAREQAHPQCLELATRMLELTRTQREKLSARVVQWSNAQPIGIRTVDRSIK